MIRKRIQQAAFPLAGVLAAASFFLKTPAGPLAAAAAVFLACARCVQLMRAPAGDTVWRVDPEDPQDIPHKVTVDPALFVEDSWLVADAWLPLREVPPEKFRSTPGAPMLAAAAALTADRLPEDAQEASASWMSALGINRENLTAHFPALGTAQLEGFEGVIVRDGATERAYFTGGPELAAACVRVMDKTGWRPLMRSDAAKLEALPRNAFFYATADVADGAPDKLTLLGCLRPREVLRVSFDAVNAADRVEGMGFEMCYDLPPDGEPNPVRLLGLPYTPCLREERALRVTRREGQPDTIRTFDRPVEALVRRKARRLSLLYRFACLAAVVAAGGALLGGHVLFQLLSGACLAACFLACRRCGMSMPSSFRWKTAVMTLLPGLALTALVWLFLSQVLPGQADAAGNAMLAGLAAVLTLAVWRSVTPGEEKRASLPLAGCGAAAALGCLVPALIASPVAGLFGLIAGVLTALAVTWFMRLSDRL